MRWLTALMAGISPFSSLYIPQLLVERRRVLGGTHSIEWFSHSLRTMGFIHSAANTELSTENNNSKRKKSTSVYRGEKESMSRGLFEQQVITVYRETRPSAHFSHTRRYRAARPGVHEHRFESQSFRQYERRPDGCREWLSHGYRGWLAAGVGHAMTPTP